MRPLLAGPLMAVLVAAGASTSASAEEAAPAPSPAPPAVVRVSVLGGFALASASFDETRPFTEFAEQGRIESSYEQDPGPGFELGAGWRFGRRLEVSAALSVGRAKESGSFNADLPHPLFFATPRRVSGEFSGRSQRTTAVHFDLGLVGGTRLQWRTFAGPSVVSARTDLVQSVEYTHAYPYDSVRVTGTPFAAASGHGFGFNLGGALAWRAARHVAIETQARFSWATVRLEPVPDDHLDVDAGGTSLAAGVRLDF